MTKENVRSHIISLQFVYVSKENVMYVRHTVDLDKYKKTMKLKDEVGMAGPKSARTRFVGIITSTT